MSGPKEDDDTLSLLTRRTVDVRRALFGGEGAVFVRDLLGARAATPFTALLSCALDPGGRVGPHRQLDDDELVVCLSGLGVFLVDDVAHEASAGAAVVVPCGSVLAIENARTDAALEYLIVKVRGPR